MRFSYIRFFALLVGMFLFLLPKTHGQSFKFGQREVFPGTRSDFRLPVSHNQDTTYIPVTVFHGTQKGPVFTITAGVHGYEYAPIMAIQKLFRNIDPTQLKGTLLIVPIANIPGFFGRTIFLNPVDGKNLNRTFPGNENGTLTEKIAWTINQQLLKRSDYYLDVHAGDGNEDLLPFACYYDRKDTPEQTAKARALTLSANFQYNLAYPYHITAKDPALYAFKESTQQGIVSASLECGKLGLTDPESITQIVTGITGMLEHTGMIAAKTFVVKSVIQQVITKQTYVYAPKDGIFFSTQKSGDTVSEGAQLGYITDVFGMLIGSVTSPVRGKIIYKTGTPPVNTGETLFCIGSE